MSTPQVKFVKTHDNAILPCANNSETGTGDSGYDLTAVEDVIVPANRSTVVPVGLTLGYIEPGFWFKIEARSGLGFKHSIIPHGGIIDNGYKGDLGVKLYNLSDKMYEVSKGDRIAQFVVYPLIQPKCSWTDEVGESARGDSGFGSSGK